MRRRELLYVPAVVLTSATALTLWLWSSGTSAGSQATTLSLFSVPDGLDVYVADAGQPDALFDYNHFKGRTPLTVQVEAGEYQLGYLATKAPMPAHLGAIEEVQPGVQVASFYRDATLIHYHRCWWKWRQIVRDLAGTEVICLPQYPVYPISSPLNQGLSVCIFNGVIHVIDSVILPKDE